MNIVLKLQHVETARAHAVINRFINSKARSGEMKNKIRPHEMHAITRIAHIMLLKTLRELHFGEGYAF